MPQLSCAPTKYLIPERIENTDGVGPAIDLGELQGKLLVVTLGINDVLEEEGLAISIWGSSSGTGWGPRPLLSMPPKSYCGVYATILNLARHPEVRFLRVQWTMIPRSQRNSGLKFGFYVALEDSLSHINAQVA